MNLYPWLSPAWSSFQGSIRSGKLAHALLVQGPEGTGKNELAMLMAARLLCTEESEFACGQCRSCSLFDSGAHPDWFLLEPPEGKQQILIDQVRETISSLALTASFSERKVALIVPAETMTNSAANALLKSLEEPPGETVIILVSHDASRLPVTIRSRCQSIGVPLPGPREAKEWLAGTTGLDADSVESALAAAGGSPLRAVEYARSGLVEKHQGLLRKLDELLNNPAKISAVASELSEIETGALWAWLSLGSADALRSVLSGTHPGWLNNQARIDRKSLAVLQQSADRNRLLSRTPVRQDLLLQDWLIKWSRLAA